MACIYILHQRVHNEYDAAFAEHHIRCFEFQGLLTTRQPIAEHAHGIEFRSTGCGTKMRANKKRWLRLGLIITAMASCTTPSPDVFSPQLDHPFVSDGDGYGRGKRRYSETIHFRLSGVYEQRGQWQDPLDLQVTAETRLGTWRGPDAQGCILLRDFEHNMEEKLSNPAFDRWRFAKMSDWRICPDSREKSWPPIARTREGLEYCHFKISDIRGRGPIDLGDDSGSVCWTSSR